MGLFISSDHIFLEFFQVLVKTLKELKDVIPSIDGL
jgi:hypothetical protein